MLKPLFLCAALALALLAPKAAQAHAVLVNSTPAAKSAVAGDSVEFALRYNSRVDAKRSHLSLKGPGGDKSLPTRQGKTEADLAASVQGLAPGAYTLVWEVLSVDGHVSRGKVPFTVGAR